MFDGQEKNLGKEAIDALTQQTVRRFYPGVAADVKLTTVTIRGVGDQFTDTVVPAFANGISMVLARGNWVDGRLDGAGD